VEKIGSSHRYRPTRQGLRALTALLVLRDKVIKPLLASRLPTPTRAEGKEHYTPRPNYHRLQAGMRDLFAEMGIAA